MKNTDSPHTLAEQPVQQRSLYRGSVHLCTGQPDTYVNEHRNIFNCRA